MSKDEAGYRLLTFREPILNEPDCYTASCHVHQEGQNVLGFLQTEFTLKEIDTRLAQHMKVTSLYLLFFVAIIATVLSIILWKIIIKPVSELSNGMKKVSDGDLSKKITTATQDEIGRLAKTFNQMTEELTLSKQKRERWNKTLEKEIERQTTEIKSVQENLIQAEKLAALGRLTADIAHEIRNPLTALGGFGRRLLKSAITDKQKEYAKIVVSESSRLEKILHDVLTFSRDTRLNLEKISVTDTVNYSVLFFSDILYEHNIKIEVNFKTDLPVLIDKEHVRQAINNLILNSIDAMDGGGKLVVSTKEEYSNNISYVAIHVADTGHGIQEDKIKLIFEPFFTEKDRRGTGLGLSITRKILEEQGGFVTAMNNPDGGCVISLYFPYQSEEDTKQIPCWEYMQCGRDMNSETRCPAYKNFGRICWAVAGTLCAGKVQGTFAQKILNCRECEFYIRINEEKELQNDTNIHSA